MRQSSGVLSGLPACALVMLVLALPIPSAAQTRYNVNGPENFRRSPSPTAPVLARVMDGVPLTGRSTGGTWIEVTLAGWIWAPSVEPTQGDFDLRVAPRNGENLRAGPNGRIVARLRNGTLLNEDTRQGNWVGVYRVGWVWSASLIEVVAASPVSPSPAQLVDSSARLDRAVLANAAALLQEPDGTETASLAAETPVKVLARSGEWVRIQTEGWIRESDLKPSAAGVLVGVSGAEVRARPAEFEGKLLQWTLQFIALQTADELRSEIPEGQSYALTRGPLPEAGFVYVTFSPAQQAEIDRLGPLEEVVVIGRVRSGRSRYLGNPVVELVDLAFREH